MTWFYLRTAQGMTPVAVDQMREMVRSGRVRADAVAASLDGASWHSIDAAIAAHTFALPAGIAESAGAPAAGEPQLLLRTQAGSRPVSVAGLRRLLQARQLTPSMRVVSTDGGENWVSVLTVTGPVAAVPMIPAQPATWAGDGAPQPPAAGPGRGRQTGTVRAGRSTTRTKGKGKGKGKRKGKSTGTGGAKTAAVRAEPNGWDTYIDVVTWIFLALTVLGILPWAVAAIGLLDTPLFAGLLLFPILIQLLFGWLLLSLLRRRQWARTIITPLCYLGMVGIPIGTVINWYMLKAFKLCGKRFT